MRRCIRVFVPVVFALAGAAGTIAAQSVERDVWLRVTSAVDAHGIAGATVAIDGTPLSRTDSSGVTKAQRARAGVHALQVTALGYRPVGRVVQVAADGPDTLRVVMAPTVTNLDTVNVRTTATEPRMFDFERRRIRGFGRFLDRAQLDSSRGQPLESVLRAKSGALFVSGPNGGEYLVVQSAPPAISGGGKPCLAAVYRDGVRLYPMLGGGDPVDLRRVLVDDLDGVEYYPQPSFLPIELRDGASLCGVLVMWTRGNH